MAISLTTDGLRVDYRNAVQSSVSGTYPIGTAIATAAELTLPGTWAWMGSSRNFGISSTVKTTSIAVRVK